MKKTLSVLIIIIVIAIGFGLYTQVDWKQPTPTQKPLAQKEGLYERVLRTGKIRCSYASYPPYCIKDPNSGELSGIFVDVLEKIGNKLELDIEWVEEVGWGTIFEGLESGRHDMFGTGLWQNSSRGKRGYFSKPIFYNGVRIWAVLENREFRHSKISIPRISD